MNIFSMFAKDLVAASHGKIRVFQNGWEFNDKGVTNAQGVFLKAWSSPDGRMKSLALGVRSTNNCPKPPGDYPQCDHGGYSVPMSACRKCPHHIKRARRQPYPCCAVLREIRQKGPGPAEQMMGMIQKATDQVAEMMK